MLCLEKQDLPLKFLMKRMFRKRGRLQLPCNLYFVGVLTDVVATLMDIILMNIQGVTLGARRWVHEEFTSHRSGGDLEYVVTCGVRCHMWGSNP